MSTEPTLPGDDDAYDPTRHYNTVVDAWDHLLGEDLHYGYFSSDQEALTEATDALTNEMLALAQLRPGLKVLDVGCGTGKAGCRIASEYDCELTGISPSISCVEKAAARAGSAGCADRAAFVIGDGTQLQFDDGAFDRAWVMESSHLMDDKPALLAECARVLKPGGRLMLCDLMLQRKLSLMQVIEYRDQFLLLKESFGRARMETLAFYGEQMQANGLVVEHSRDISGQTFPTFDRWRENAQHRRDQVTGHIGEQAWRQFRDSCDVLTDFWQAHIMGYGIICAVKPETP